MSGRRSRRGHGGGGGGGGGHGGGDARWLVTYADLLTLLMVLFLVLWVISTIDLKKFEKFKSGLGDFGNKAAAAAKDPSVTDPLSTDIIGAVTTTSIVIPSTTEATGSTGPNGEATSTTLTGGGTGKGGGPVLDQAGLDHLKNGLQGAIDNAGLTGVVTLIDDPRGIVIAVATDDVLFDAGSATLASKAQSVIGVVAPQLSSIGNNVVVEGYTDKRPLKKGGGYDNWDLSVDRAVRVVKMLRDSFGVDPSRLSATGYGEQHPIATGNDEASLAKNRRVQIVVTRAGATP
jgi:chemotaxis protein MotB